MRQPGCPIKLARHIDKSIITIHVLSTLVWPQKIVTSQSLFQE